MTRTHNLSCDSDPFPYHRQPTVRVLAMPEHTNPSGNVFGGWIMAQMDIAGAIVAIEYAQSRVATVAVASMKFDRPVFVGDLVSCFTSIEKIGNTSITVRVEVFAQRIREGRPTSARVTEATLTYVAVDRGGLPQPLPQRDFTTFHSLYG